MEETCKSAAKKQSKHVPEKNRFINQPWKARSVTQIRCRAIIEMLGAPKEYIDKILRDYIAKIKNEGAKIVSERYEEAVQQDKLFSNFVEMEILFDKPSQLLSFCFESMPSSIEIIEPEALVLPSFE